MTNFETNEGGFYLERPSSTEYTVLSEEQQRALEIGPGMVSKPVQLYKYKCASDLNNFVLHLIKEGNSIAWISYGQKPCSQRFRIIYPELAAFIGDHINDFNPSRPGLDNDERGKFLLDVYDIMCTLVDEDDPYVKANDGTVDDGYLWR